MEWDWRASEVGARRKTKQKPAMVEPVEIPDAEHELVVDRGAAIDVAKAAGKVCVRLPGKSGRRFSRVWDVPARTGAITELAEQLVELGIEKVTVESTSDYWRIWYYLLEDAGLDVQLVNSRDVRNVPGRPKTDKLDAVWLAKLTEKGLVRPSFVPFDINKNFFRITSLEVAFDVDGMLVGLSSAAPRRCRPHLREPLVLQLHSPPAPSRSSTLRRHCLKPNARQQPLNSHGRATKSNAIRTASWQLG